MKNLTVLLIATFALVNMQAQRGGERLEALKVSYITNELDLTPEEAQVFWPVYNEYQNKLKALKKERRQQILDKWKHRENMSETEIDKSLDQFLEYQQQETELEKTYIQKFRKLLPLKKVAQLIVVEERFKLHILKELKKRREHNHGPGR